VANPESKQKNPSRRAYDAGGGPGGGSRGGGIGGRGVGLDLGGGSRGASFGGLGIRAMAVPLLLPAGAGEPNSLAARRAGRPWHPDSRSGSAFFPGVALLEGGKGGQPQRVRRCHDLHIVKRLKPQVPFMGAPRGFVEVLQFEIDLGH